MADTYKVKSDYTILRRKSRLTSKGDVYENNLMTITPIEVLLPEGQNVIYSDSNFKFSIRTDANLKHRHTKSDWVKTELGGVVWTLEDVIDSTISEESEVRIKPDYNSLRDFAYYGSAVEMVHATVNHVLMHFPGELYFSDEPFVAYDRNGNKISMTGYYKVYNECEINIETDFIDENNVENPNRYLCLSIGNYNKLKNGEIIKENLTRGKFNKNENFCGDGILGTVDIDGITVTVYVSDNVKYYLHKNAGNAGVSIRPKQNIIDEYFATIDDFERVLLNTESEPLYKAIFETVVEKDDGYYYNLEPYIWPSINNWTPDMNSSAYQSYIMRLISLAQQHDEYDSNNIWRMLTHEAIKNLDWTFFRESGDDVEDLSKIDSSRIEAMIQLYGRQFDGLKRYIDNIKNANKITYDQKNNVPDYLLTDAVEMSGFDAILPNPKAKSNVTLNKSLFDGLSKKYSEVDANTFFMRNLKLNAPYLNSAKGTREGVEAMLAILGFGKDDFEINEYVTIAKGHDNSYYCKMDSDAISNIPESEAERSSNCKYPAAIDVEMINMNKDFFPTNVNFMVSQYNGIACKPIEVYKEDGTIDYRYVVPWYENGKQYDGDWYFQCDGGWGKKDLIDVTEVSILGQPLGIEVLSGDTLYEETKSRLKFAENLEEMLDIYPNNLENDDICYVTDISNLKTIQNGVYADIDETPMSHYFVINNKENYCVLGDSGWAYIRMSDITSSNPSSAATKVIYLETIKASTLGNNPHVANRPYDNGKRYVDCLDSIFKYSIENEQFSYFSDLDVHSAITTYNFNISSAYTVDNRKAEYFRREEQSSLQINGTSGLREVEDFCCDYGEKIVNPENEDKHLEAAANSIINLKNLEIGYYAPYDLEELYDGDAIQWRENFEEVIEPYIKQMLPSTTILRWKYLGVKENECSGSVKVTPNKLYFVKEGESKTITITAKKQGWTITNIPEWLTLSQTSGDEGTTTVTVSCGANSDESEKNDTFVVKGKSSGSGRVQCVQQAENPVEPVYTYRLTHEYIDGKSINAYAPRQLKAILIKYNSAYQDESTIVSKTNVTDKCAWSYYTNKTGVCSKEPCHSDYKVVGVGENSYCEIWQVTIMEHGYCPWGDSWQGIYTDPETGKEYGTYTSIRLYNRIWNGDKVF